MSEHELDPGSSLIGLAQRCKRIAFEPDKVIFCQLSAGINIAAGNEHGNLSAGSYVMRRHVAFFKRLFGHLRDVMAWRHERRSRAVPQYRGQSSRYQLRRRD